ncbi:MAG: sugar phosphate isomerase/epimerase family protein [Bacteroidota bacterium]
MSSGGPRPLPLGIVSDEIDQDFRTALRHGLDWGIRRYEIRCLTSGRVPDVDTEEWEAVVRTTAAEGVSITALSPGIFKHPLGKRDELEHEVTDTLSRTVNLATSCGAKLIIVFGFRREEGEPPERRSEAVDLLRRAAATAQRAGMKIAVENEPGFHADTGVNTRRLIEEVGSPALGANWDPCNATGTDERPYPEGYEAIKPVIVNVHAKDTKEGALIKCVPIGEGIIDWAGQVRALLKDRIVPHITIETHCLPLVEQSERNVRTLRLLMEREYVP